VGGGEGPAEVIVAGIVAVAGVVVVAGIVVVGRVVVVAGPEVVAEGVFGPGPEVVAGVVFRSGPEVVAEMVVVELFDIDVCGGGAVVVVLSFVLLHTASNM